MIGKKTEARWPVVLWACDGLERTNIPIPALAPTPKRRNPRRYALGKGAGVTRWNTQCQIEELIFVYIVAGTCRGTRRSDNERGLGGPRWGSETNFSTKT